MSTADGLRDVMVVVYGLALVGTLAVLLTSWRRRRTTMAAGGLAIAMSGVTLWTAADLVVMLDRPAVGTSPTLSEVFFCLVVAGAAVAMAGFWVLARGLSDRDWRPVPRTWALLSIHPLVMVALVPLNPATGIVLRMRPRTTHASWPTGDLGPAFWLHTVVSYVLLGWSAAMVVRTFRGGSPLQRRQAGSVLAGALIPMAPNLITIFTRPGTVPELTAIAFTLTGLVDGYALFRQGLLTLVPVARTLVLDRLSDAVVVIDPDGRLLDVNASGERLIRALAPHLPPRLVGTRASDILTGHHMSRPLTDGVYDVDLPSGRTVLDVRVDRLTGPRGALVAHVVVVRDVTDVQLQREALDRLRADLAEQALRDELTGLHNRRFLVGELDRTVKHAVDGGGDLWALIIDVDHFKSVNDRHGHAVGDLLLAAIAAALTFRLRPGDTVARYGGEEFVVLLPSADREHVLPWAEEARRRCEAVVVPSDEGPVSRTVSVGVASLRGSDRHGEAPTSAEGLLRAADRALYAAKDGGRDRVILACDVVDASR